ncbi:MAG: tetraacyldisaccharide 4'-kinase [Flavobacteriaceae bacterium]|nr:tetraacyldisaccharide 4'-kinase [Bacteroidia bacterium]NNL16583.1 tetraacyldisaccharide 4'-kinase [Flavobacteriaceae bacterium]
MKLLRKILFPFVPVYYLVSSIRNKLFDLNILKSKSYNIPLICIGNLSVGGTGKTPLIEYLIRLLKNDYSLATLSRGYKRNTTGFILANDKTNVEELGDEPFQIKNKFKDILVAVDGNRQNGIEQLLALNDPPEIILLDDGFQHRKVKAGLSILLTQYSKLYVNDIVLPTGDLRESRSGAKRADIIIVTKCPENLKDEERTEIISILNVSSNQRIFFSTISYSDTIFSKEISYSFDKLSSTDFTLITGIADSGPLIDYLNSKGLSFNHFDFKDHYNFNEKDIMTFNNQEFLLTTEKDYMRLKNKVDNSKLYYLPIETRIFNDREFDKMIKDFILKF